MPPLPLLLLLLLRLLLAVAAELTLGSMWVAAHDRKRKGCQSPVGRTFAGGSNGDKEEIERAVAGKEPTESKTWKDKKRRMFWFLA